MNANSILEFAKRNKTSIIKKSLIATGAAAGLILVLGTAFREDETISDADIAELLDNELGLDSDIPADPTPED